LIANGGTNGGHGGTIRFIGDSLGGTSRIEVFGNGSLDISQHSSPGVTVGSIEGDGNVFVGARTLTVGSSNASTVFAGSIQSGGAGGGSFGGLTKIGSGTLTLSGASTYGGETHVNGGKLIVNGSITTDFVDVISGGTLSGSGTINGDLLNFGTVAPGDPVTLHVVGAVGSGRYYEQGSGGLLRIVIDGASSFDNLAVTGDVFLDAPFHGDGGAILELDFINGFAPTAGQQFDFLTFSGTENGSFSQVNIVGLQPGFQFSVGQDATGQYGMTALNDGVSTSVPEPASLALLGIAGIGLITSRRSRRPAR
jgi:autotransporter-associated beta strand protein